ncbi:MAG: deoxyribose-phosphate aldolase [Planctomycetes bacterium]|nr:deoxyribose-phosphate aldolase [Planctomycetota bacterium]
MFTREQVAKAIDHAVLKPNFTDKDVAAHCKMCVERGVGNICVRPTDVAAAVKATRGSHTTVACVIGFPHGSNRSEVKALEARLAIKDGANELDMVMNIGKFLSGDYAFVQKDIEAVVAEAKPKGVLVKVILETSLLTPDQVATACKLAEAAHANFVKTSTGFADGGATPEVIDIMLKTVGKTMGVKASGGVRSWETAIGYLKQGCKRLGVGSTEKVLDGAPDAGTGY